MNNSEIIRNRKFFKRNKILSIIRYSDNISRNDVKKLTLYSIPTVRDIIDELINEGLVYEEECDDSRIGRRPIWLKLNPSGAYFIGVEFNANNLYCSMLNFIGQVVCQSSDVIEQNSSVEVILKKIESHIEACISQIEGGKNKCFGICVGVPGYYDKSTELSISYSHLSNWKNVPIKKIIEERFQLPCYIENNVNVMAFAYKWLYYNGDAEDFIFVSVRTGVRMVPVVDNNLILSKSGFSGQLGHIKVPGSNRICSCGKYGCLNSEVSEAALVGLVKDGIAYGRFKEIAKMSFERKEDISINMICESINKGHDDSRNLMLHAAKILGDAMSTVVNIFAPEVMVLSGDLPNSCPEFIEAVNNVTKNHIIQENLTNLRITSCAFDKDIGAKGAAAYVMQEQFEFIDKQI